MNAWHNLWLPSLFTDTETEDSTFDDFYLSEKEAKIVELQSFAKSIKSDSTKILQEEEISEVLLRGRKSVDMLSLSSP